MSRALRAWMEVKNAWETLDDLDVLTDGNRIYPFLMNQAVAVIAAVRVMMDALNERTCTVAHSDECNPDSCHCIPNQVINMQSDATKPKRVKARRAFSG